jgi:hypothetical protein
VAYPGDWAVVAERIDERPGEVVSLPFNAYRAYAWNGRRVVLDPAPRWLPAPVLVDDTLRVGPFAVAGESPRAAQIRRRLAAGRPVADDAVAWVLVQRGVGGDVPAAALDGLRPVYEGTDLALYANPASRPPVAGRSMRGWALAAHLLAAGLVALAVFRVLHTRLPRGNVPAPTRPRQEGDV